MIKKVIFFVLIFIIFGTCSAYAQTEGEMFTEPISTTFEKAEVIKITETEREATEEDFLMFPDMQTDKVKEQELEIKILSGKHEDKTINVQNTVTNNPLDFKLKEGSKIVLYLQEFKDGTLQAQIQDYYRLSPLIWFIVLFLILLLIFGKLKGLKTIISLAISIFLIFKVLIPKALDGTSPLWLAILISIIATVVTLLLIAGFKRKATAAIFGTISGVLVAAILAIIFGKISHLSGLSTEESRLLFDKFPELNLQGILFAGIVIGALGAVMDVAMSISSSISEVKKAHPEISFKKLVKSGFSVGKDIMGTMSNTLILAYVGSALPLLLLFASYQESYLKILNFEFLAEEVVRSMAGSIGLIAAIPLTALIAGWLESRKKSKFSSPTNNIHKK